MDGTKIRASNNKKKSFTPQILDKKLDYLREQAGRIEEYLNKMDQEDEAEQKHARILELDIRPKDMPEKLKQLREPIIYAAPSIYWASARLSRTLTKESRKSGAERPLFFGFWTRI